jgi:hypothetical protein
VRLLLTRGADPMVRNNNHEDAVMIARASRNAVILALVQRAQGKSNWWFSWLF